MEVGEIQLRFDPSEFYALAQLARKYGTDLGSILRIGGKLVLEAERREAVENDRSAFDRPGDDAEGGRVKNKLCPTCKTEIAKWVENPAERHGHWALPDVQKDGEPCEQTGTESRSAAGSAPAKKKAKRKQKTPGRSRQKTKLLPPPVEVPGQSRPAGTSDPRSDAKPGGFRAALRDFFN